jgi:hypothetical protein
MKPVKLIASVSTIAILGLLAANVGAQQTNVQERTFITFSSAVEMPGVVLEPGTYEFRLADTPRRNVVQVYRKDGTDIVGQWTFVDSQRQRVSDETVVMFRETAEGTTPAVQYWYYPGEKIGKEFIYPKDQAERIAARTGQPVRSDEGVAAASDSEPSDVQARADADANRDAIDIDADARVDADADVDRADAQASAAQQQPSAAAQPSAPAGSTTGNRGVTAQAETDAPDAEASARADASVSSEQPRPPQAERDPAESQVARQQQPADPARPVGTTGSAQQQADSEVRAAGELPNTASPLALAGLLGLLSLAGAAGLRRFSR